MTGKEGTLKLLEGIGGEGVGRNQIVKMKVGKDCPDVRDNMDHKFT